MSVLIFSFRFKEDGEIKYLEGAKELNLMERYTLEVSFEDVEKYNQNLATTIIEEYYRFVKFNVGSLDISIVQVDRFSNFRLIR
jgi:Predicted ATPase involved in replication control, Cdc46/Mcm family